MSNTIRNLLTIILVVLMAATAFVAGYLVNDYVSAAGASENGYVSQSDFELFWEAWDWTRANYIGDLPQSKQVVYAAIRGAMSEINDPYTLFVEPIARDAERDRLRGNFGGVGVYLNRNESGEIELTPIKGNPAMVAGIRSGDILIAIDGMPITGNEAIETLNNQIRGEKGTKVTLLIRHAGSDDDVSLEIVRDYILLPSVAYRLVEEDPQIGYIQLSRFSGESSAELFEAIIALRQQGATKFILDLRGNPGGLVDAAVDVSNHFLHEGIIFYQITRDDGETEKLATADTIAPDEPLVVLIDGGTASSAEIVAGALQDRDRAILIGSTSFGKGSVQLVHDLADGSSIHVTAARWLTPNRQQIDRHGLQPDIGMTLTATDGADETLARAVSRLQTGQ